MKKVLAMVLIILLLCPMAYAKKTVPTDKKLDKGIAEEIVVTHTQIIWEENAVVVFGMYVFADGSEASRVTATLQATEAEPTLITDFDDDCKSKGALVASEDLLIAQL